MTTTEFRKKLIELGVSEKEENKIAKVLAHYYPSLDLNNRDSLFESLMRLYKLSNDQNFDFDKLSQEIQTDVNIFDADSFRGKDFRIKDIEISSLRGIPEKDENGIPFGLNLVDDGIINNAVILANNGTGKSSIFAGLEMIYAQEIGEKNLRTESYWDLKKENYNNYIDRFTSTSSTHCKINTVSGEYDLNKIVFMNEDLRKVFNPKNFFISDFDIYENGKVRFTGDNKDTNSLHSIVARSLGLEEFLQLQNLLLQIPTYRRSKESARRTALNKQLDEQKDILKNTNDQIQIKQNEVEELKKVTTSNPSKKEVSKVQKIESLRSLLNKDFKIHVSSEKSLTETISAFNSSYQFFLSKVKDKRSFVERDFLEAGKEILHDFENCPFCMDSNKSIEEIQKNVEQRLEELKEIQKIDKEIKEAYRDLSTNLSQLLTEFNRIYELITIERAELIPFVDLSKIGEKEDTLYVQLSPLLNDIELYEHIYSLSQKSIPNEKDYLTLYELLENNPTLFKEGFVNIIASINSLSLERNDSIEKVIDQINSQETTIPVAQQTKILNDEIEKLKIQIPIIEKQISDLAQQHLEANKDVELVDRVKREVGEYNLRFGVEINNIVSQVFEPIKDVVESIMKDYFENDPQNEFKIHIKSISVVIDGVDIEDKHIVAEIINKHSNKTTTPDQYFNTFRYKLFCLMVSLSIALATRKKYQINLPLVIDDIFFASDFASKNSFSNFLHKVIEVFYKHTPDLPLQFILFTHDDIIFRSSMDSIEKNIVVTDDIVLCEENKSSLVSKTLVGRFFNPEDKDDLPSYFEDNRVYWDLLYKIPKLISHL
ncbi:MAG: hypothetical protein KAF41_04815 [Flavobacterium sp.]|nr:hypothetical protein [Flavobacterium sp.]PZO33532.1 MAG: hypothetical protein DCE86_04430 [Flavobacteriaceae bacterium]